MDPHKNRQGDPQDQLQVSTPEAISTLLRKKEVHTFSAGFLRSQVTEQMMRKYKNALIFFPILD
jgi:hypothetical protein